MADPTHTGNEDGTTDQRWLDIVLAIADGAPVDWHAEPSPTADTDSPNPVLGRQLRLLERLVRGHDELRDSTERLDAPLQPRFAETELLEVRWGPLIVREKLGHGSFGDVYRAWDPQIEREVALKIVVETLEAERPVIDEARRLARVAHPNVLAVYGAERIDGRTGIWMQYVRGRTPDDDVREHGRLAPDDVIHIGIEVAKALGAVHAAGLVHGDVKARNVLRDTDGRVLLCDFGASLDLDDAAPDAPAPTAGTLLYLAPEILNGAPASHAGDFYALGVLLFFLATGTYPVRGRTAFEIRDAHAQERRVQLDAERPALPARLVAAVDRLLRLDPRERPNAAAAIERELGGPADERSAPWKWIGVAAIVAATALGVWAWLAPGRNRATGTREVVSPPCWSVVSATGWMACASRTGPTQRIVLFQPATNTLRPIRDVPDGLVREAIISPDGRRVAYSLQARPDQNHPDQVRVLDVGTAADRLVVALPAALELASLRAWWPRADALEMFVRSAGSRFVLDRLDVASGRLEPVFDFPSVPEGHATSPDGHLLAFDVRGADGARDIRACRLDDKTCVTVTSNPADDFRPFWSPDGALFFTSSRSGEYGLWRATGNVMTSADQPTLVKDLGRSQLVPLGFDATGALYYDLVGSRFDLSIARLDQAHTGATTELEHVSRDATSLDTAPTWSAGDKLAYFEQRGPFAETDALFLAIQSAAGTVDRRIPLTARLASSHLAWAPDGRRVAFAGIVGDLVTASHVPAIHVFDAETGAETDTFQPQNADGPLGWIDDDTVAYSLGRGIGAYDFAHHVDRALWVAPPTVRVMNVAVSGDGRELAVTARARDGSAWKIFVVPVAGPTTAEPLVSAGQWIQAQDWMPSGHALLLSVPSATAPAPAVDLVARPIDGGSDTVLLRGVLGLTNARISPDGKRLAVVVQMGVHHEISMELPRVK